MPENSAPTVCSHSRTLCLQSGNTTLHVAAAKGAVEIVKLLISAGSPVDVKNKVGLALLPWQPPLLRSRCSNLVLNTQYR